MPRFEDNIFGQISQHDWLNVGFNVTRQNDPIDALLDDVRTDNLIAEWESLAAEYQIPRMAQFHGFDTEAQTTVRFPIDSHNIEKGLIKVKINQSERLRALSKNIPNSAMYDYVLDDGINLAEQVFTRSKVAKNELLAYGKVTIKENNLDLTVDYGVPTNHTNLQLDLSESADIPAQLQTIIDNAMDEGVTFNTIVTSKKNVNKIRKNTAVQQVINGSAMEGALVRQDALEAYLSTEFGIERIVTNDLLYAVDDGIDVATGRPKVKKHRYFPADKVSFLSTNANGRIGTGLWGNPPELDDPTITANFSGAFPFVYVSQHWEWDPHVLWTKASGLFMPVLFSPDSLFIATVTGE